MIFVNIQLLVKVFEHWPEEQILRTGYVYSVKYFYSKQIPLYYLRNTEYAS